MSPHRPEPPHGSGPVLVHVDSIHVDPKLAESWSRAGGTLHALAGTSRSNWIECMCGEVERLVELGVEPVVALVASDARRIEVEVRLLESGCDDVLWHDCPSLPTHLDSLTASLRRQANGALQLEAAGLTGRSQAMVEVRRALVPALDDSDLPLILLGETGTGKSLAARALHDCDPVRNEQRFHALDCGAVAPTLFGSELFGHVRGSFTGAATPRAGALATAGGGTLLLDEVGELAPELQSAFLGALQERSFRPLGADRDQPIECRIVAATNRDLPTVVSSGAFRADLYHRLNGLSVRLPPLRERREDVPELFLAFARKCVSADAIVDVSPEVLEWVTTSDLPGNVRQLENLVRRAVRRAGGGVVRASHVAPDLLDATHKRARDERDDIDALVAARCPLEVILERLGKRAVHAALAIAAADRPNAARSEVVRRAAEWLGVSERTIYNRLQLRASVPAATDGASLQSAAAH